MEDEQFLSNPFDFIDYLSDWFGWFLGGGHDTNKLLFLCEKGRYAIDQNYAAFSAPLFVGFPEDYQILHAPKPIRHARPPSPGPWRGHQLTDGGAKNIIYDAFLKDDLAMPRHLLRPVHYLYFDPKNPEFAPRTLWSLTNAFRSALKELDPVPQFKATAKLGNFFASLN